MQATNNIGNGKNSCLFVAHDEPSLIGGVHTWMETLLPMLLDRGMDCSVALFLRGEEGLLTRHLRQSGLRIFTHSHFEPFRDRVGWLRNVIEKSRAKIVVQNYLVAGFAAATSLRAKGVRSIAVLHSDDPLYRSLVESQRNGDLAVEFDHAVAVSCFLKELVRERLGEDFPASRIPYGISRNVGTASPPAEQFRLVYVGRLVQEQKRICDVVTALCRAVREIPGVTADIIGDGSDRKTAEEVLISNGSPPQVRFLGAITPAEVRRRLPHYHAKVLLSDYEGLPVSLLEAMSAGVVPVCTAMRSGINELVMHDQSGIIVEDRQNGFISAVRQLRQNQPLWTSLSSRAREMARAFDAETCADQWTAVINKVEQMKVFKARTIKFGRQHFPRWRQEFDWDMQRKPSTIENVASTWRIRFGRYRSKILHNYSR